MTARSIIAVALVATLAAEYRETRTQGARAADG